MCLICTEVIKENLKPADFWRNYKELLLQDNDHWKEVVENVNKSSEKYKQSLMDYWKKDEEK